MQEVYDLFIRDIVTTAERKNLTAKHPEFELLMQEYRDGILLFDISNKEVWNKPMDRAVESEVSGDDKQEVGEENGSNDKEIIKRKLYEVLLHFYSIRIFAVLL